MTVMNDLDRFHLVLDVIPRLPESMAGAESEGAAKWCRGKLREHHDYIRANGDDMPEVRDSRWPA